MQLSYYAITSSGKWLNNKLICLKINCNQVSALLLHYSPGPDLCQAEYLPHAAPDIRLDAVHCLAEGALQLRVPCKAAGWLRFQLQVLEMRANASVHPRSVMQRLLPFKSAFFQFWQKAAASSPCELQEEGGIEMNEVTVSTAADKETSVDVAALAV